MEKIEPIANAIENGQKTNNSAMTKGWHERSDSSGKASKHCVVSNKKKLSNTLRTPIKPTIHSSYSNYNPLERKIAEMMTENTGTHFLDSGGESGRFWQRNQGKDFKKEQPSTYKISKIRFSFLEIYQ